MRSVQAQTAKRADELEAAMTAQRPPMGWSSWNKFHCSISEELIRNVSDQMVGHKLGEFALTRTFKGHPADKKAKK